MNVGSQVASSNTKFTINGQTKTGSVEGQVILSTTRKVVVQDGDSMYQITPANFANNFEEVHNLKTLQGSSVDEVVSPEVFVDQVNDEVVEQSTEQQVQVETSNLSSSEKVDSKTKENKISRKDQVAQQMDLGVVGATAIAKVIGMNASYCQRLVGQINKANDAKVESNNE